MQMKDQMIRDHKSSLFHGATGDVSVCAYVCTKDETCLTFSYHKETQECLLSSDFPEVAENEDANLVFMKGIYQLFVCS